MNMFSVILDKYLGVELLGCVALCLTLKVCILSEKFYVHSKTETNVHRFLMYLLSLTYVLLIVHIPQQSDAFVTINTLPYHITQGPQFILQFTLGTVLILTKDFEKCIMMCIYYCSII